MSVRPAVTVLMPAYNAAAFLEEAIRSVLQQSFTDLELLIIDDGSTDGTAEVVAAFNDPRINYVRHSANRGLVAVLNEGLDLAQGTYVARMDADDIMRPERIEKQFRYLQEHKDIHLVATFVDVINPDGELTGVWDTDRKAVTETEIRSMMPRTTCIAHPTVMIRRSTLGNLRYDPRMVEGEDWELWLRMQSRGFRIAKIPEALLLYRQHPNSFTGAAKARRPVELRLLLMRHRFLIGEWKAFRFKQLHVAVLIAQARSLARHLLSNVFPPFLQSVHRILTYSIVRMLRERSSLQRTLSDWNGQHVFVFPYLSMGGAEQVHLGIVASVKDQDPLVVISGFSADRGFEDRFKQCSTVVEIPRLLNHPWTRGAAQRAIARKMDGMQNATLLGSLSGTFFDLLPRIKKNVKAYYVQHAFLYQPNANLQQKRWLKYFDRVNGYLFPSAMAKNEFDKFLFRQNIAASRASKLILVPCAAPALGEVNEHAKLGILFVGRDSPEKRLDLFLKIAAELEGKSPCRFRFTVAGPQPRTGHSHVAFKGIIRDARTMSDLYSDHDALVLTSSREGHCLVVTEAMAQGLAVLSTPVGDVPDRVDDMTGLLTSSTEEPDVLKEMLVGIIALDADRARLRELKENARERIRRAYDPEKFYNYYRSLLIGPKA
jgi:glycosyltransferase involved in cell wall biosynthesis